jgi:hypothetical protein
MFPSVPPGECYCKTGQNYFHIIPDSSLTIILSLGTILPTQPKSIIRELYSLQPLKMSLMVGKCINWWLYDGMVPSVKVNRNTIQVFWDVMLHQLVNSDWHFQRFSGSRSTQSSFEVLVIIYQPTWCNVPKDLNRQQHHCDNLDLASTETHSQRVLANVTTGCYW